MIPKFGLFAFLPSFGSGVLLWWLVAAAAPVLIHLLSRRKYRVLEWAAMRYLQEAVKRRSRRIQIEQLLLLLLRILLVALVVIALAQPYLDFLPFAGVVGGVRTHRVIVLDASYSMTLRVGQQTLFQRAQALVRETLVARGGQGDGYTLVLMSSPPQEVVGLPAFQAETFLQELEALPEPQGRADVAGALRKVEELIQRVGQKHPDLKRVEVHVLTDLGRSTWFPDASDKQGPEELKKWGEKLAEAATLVLWDLGQADAENTAVTGLQLAQPLATAHSAVEVEVQVEHYGRQPRLAQKVQLYWNGRVVGEQDVALEPRVAKTLRFSHDAGAGGDQTLEVRLADDPLALDNRWFAVVPVKETLQVLLVNGRPAGDPWQGATEYLRNALLSTAPGRGGAVIVPEVVPETAILEIPQLERYEGIFLCEVSRFTKNEAQRLAAYSQQGGGLVFFLGPQVEAENYNRWLAGDDPQGVKLLPARLGDVIAQPADAAPLRLDPLAYQHPIVAVWRGNPLSGLLETPIRKYYRFELPPGGPGRPVLGIQGGGPLVVEGSTRPGRVVVIGTPGGRSDWNYFSVWPSFVPVVQEIMKYALTRPDDGSNRLVGQPLLRNVGGVGAGTATVETPPGKKEQVRLTAHSDARLFSFTDTAQSGLYRADLPDAKAWFAVNLDTRESDLAKLEMADFRRLIWPASVPFHTELAPAGEGNVPAAGRSSTDWHMFLLYAVLALLFVETFLGWKFAHHTPAS